MRGGHRVAWRAGVKVFHRAKYGDRLRAVRHPDGTRRMAEVTVVPCGVVLWSPLEHPMEGSEVEAKRLGLRPCRRCFP